MSQRKPFKPILDRVLLKLVHEKLPEGEQEFRTSERFRQQTNKGEVLAVGDVVVLSMQKFAITDFVNVGDYVLFGQYTAEEFTSDELFQQFKLSPDDQIYIVRVQDIRGSAQLVKDE